MRKSITPEMEAFVRSNYLKMPGGEIAKHLGVSKSCINAFKRKNGLHVPIHLCYQWKGEAQAGRTTFTPEQDQFIKDNYLKIPTKRIARLIGKSEYGTFSRLKKLGLKVPAPLKEEWKLQGLKKGHGWNKGMRQSEYMDEDSIRRTMPTRFKKGELPHNTRETGDISLRSDGYVWIRTGLAAWEKLHRLIYSWHHGIELTCQDNIIFKDGNHNNFKIKNLIRVSHEELMDRNTINRYPENLKEAMRALSKLKRTIRKKENHEKQD